MSKFPKLLLATGAIVGVLVSPALAAGDADAGKKVFNKCRACHAVGEGAANKIGPQLNELFGRAAGGLADYKYSPALTTAGEGGVVWGEATLSEFLADPKGFASGTKMGFAGLKKEDDRDDVIAYLATFSSETAAATDAEKPGDGEAVAEAEVKTPEPAQPETKSAENEAGGTAVAASVAAEPSGGPLSLGRPATEEEVAAWDIDVRPDGKGLPVGRGTVAEGEPIFTENCASCHGDFGEGRGRWPVLAGGFDTLTRQRPEKTVGSYWPYLSTVYDYVYRAMPFGNARSLSDDDVYALTAYILYLNDIVTDEEFELSNENFTTIEMPNVDGFIPDTREAEAHYQTSDPCITDCKPEPAKVTMRAQVLDVTPDTADSEGEGPAGGNVD
ncbi:MULTISPECIES: c-type cytochrome [unclassified Aurantimonas]|uniref:c-type cytochrome n=1 Tax=unclassified Aurantimonas TaxID=2638230 RepID=UPI002E18C518|nr:MULTISPECIES: c-type cytochrome [unclassified Aurantimonas]MEC5289201.1 c-type cytochrome [Aurantimonas sp. C2-3-R2]MEC5410349.1 c-type cytochrome [Aurantimonas sp. C2-4-R8]